MRQTISIYIYIFGFIIGLTSSLSYAAVTEVTATVDKNPVMQDESFILQIIANDDVSADAFDPSPLLKDFVVGRTSTSRQTQIVNFDTSRTTRWQTVLIPREIGRFTIPSFSIKGIATTPMTVEVLPVSQSKNAQGRDVFITTEMSKEEVYLQQQVKYVVKLHVAVDLQRGSLSAPVVEDAEIEQIGQDKEYSEIVNGKRYRIIERTFSILPQKSGTFTVQAPYFEGEMLDNSTRRSFGFFNRTRNVNRVGKNQFLTVKPIPENYKHHWLPSELVDLHDEWQGDINNLQVGVPITRTLTLNAVGVVESQLPEIASTYPNNIKTYPDQAETATVQHDGTLVSQRKESIALIPNANGTVTLPKVSVPWFNTRTGKTEFATIPEKRVQIGAGRNNDLTPVTPPANISQDAPEEPSVVPQTPTQEGIETTNGIWSLSSWVLLFVWIATLLVWFITNKKKSVKQSHALEAPMSAQEKEAWLPLLQALKKKDAQNLTNYLQHWLAVVCGNPQQSLAQSVEQLQNPQLKKQVTQYFDNRFGTQQGPDSFASLMEVLITIRKQHLKTPKTKGTQLSPLYPNAQ